jgi:hypothetical protein
MSKKFGKIHLHVWILKSRCIKFTCYTFRCVKKLNVSKSWKMHVTRMNFKIQTCKVHFFTHSNLNVCKQITLWRRPDNTTISMIIYNSYRRVSTNEQVIGISFFQSRCETFVKWNCSWFLSSFWIFNLLPIYS